MQALSGPKIQNQEPPLDLDRKFNFRAGLFPKIFDLSAPLLFLLSKQTKI